MAFCLSSHEGDTNPTMGALGLMTIYLPKASPNTITLGLESQHMNLVGEDTYIQSIADGLGQVFSGGISDTNID